MIKDILLGPKQVCHKVKVETNVFMGKLLIFTLDLSQKAEKTFKRENNALCRDTKVDPALLIKDKGPGPAQQESLTGIPEAMVGGGCLAPTDTEIKNSLGMVVHTFNPGMPEAGEVEPA